MNQTRDALEEELAFINAKINLYQDLIPSLNRRKSLLEMLLARLEDSKQLELGWGVDVYGLGK